MYQALREVDYEVRDRYFLEKVFNFEINQPVDRTIFYNGKSFYYFSENRIYAQI